MPDNDDIALLTQYAGGDESAFTLLVERYINLVYSTALRQVCNPSHAEEITQAVFIILTQKAKSLSPKTILSGWLYQTARLTASNFQRSEIRRQQREQEAYMQSTLTGSDTASWEHIAPLLDEAMGRLGEADRNAIVLRFFENKTPQEVAAMLKLNEVTARKRVSRALEKLRKFFTKRGVVIPIALLTTAISANSIQAAPVGLAATISATAAKGAAVSATITTLVKGTLKLMTYAKLKLALYIGAAIVLAGGTTTVVLSSDGAGDNAATGEIFKNAQEKYASMTSYSDEGQTVATLNGSTITTTYTIKLARPNLYQIEWQQKNDSAYATTTTKTEAVWSAGAGDFLDMGMGRQKQKDEVTALSSAAGISASASATIPGAFFKMNGGNPLGSASGQTQQADEKVGNVDCYVFTSELKKGITKTLWIGKQDFLIHQVRNVTSAEAEKAMLTKAAKDHPQIMASLAIMGFHGITSTETHSNIVVNPNLSAADFAR
jgi:RNA polymerase sigma factor (sigma-70 family)